MQPSIIVLGLLALAAIIWVVQKRRAEARRNSLFQTPLSPGQIAILESKVPLYARLPRELRKTLHGCINFFLDEKVFVGCDGLAITDEIRYVIAANACLLVVNRDKKQFSGFETILVYPDAYVAREVTYDGLVEIHGDSTRAGESWHRGPVVLSLVDVLRGSGNEEDGHNVVLHEFAHKLDEENGIMDGLPVLRKSTHYKEWAEVLTREYDEFLDRVERGTNKVIDEYGAVSAPEFFAVATESFFEKSKQMKKRLPDLYRQLQTLYGLDPAEW
ncbi:zinc-dependent peptidase [Exilibacterium tricleocarpae]|uniref:Zinc-dependent peptidase n=1 Tax=Exilibacterium tricleocarpae TaxID=2591008 RepID=A0A545TNC3_9GAMM|nr:M90 family metallopeptidase [Exilibacterium tricleocarpae]TQV78727.1 zinc-dependent peptidase [Exilibacterium tricleocarpae]